MCFKCAPVTVQNKNFIVLSLFLFCFSFNVVVCVMLLRCEEHMEENNVVFLHMLVFSLECGLFLVKTVLVSVLEIGFQMLFLFSNCD